jgi:uncharacterized Ntn-hydrolase superfamily protein
MTFTVVGRCERTGQVGVGLTTVSIAAGGLCPFYTQRGDIVVSQAFASARVGHVIAQALEAGAAPGDALNRAKDLDPHFAFRQVVVVPRSGENVAFTGPSCRPWAGHVDKGHVIAAGNVLGGEHVLAAMIEGFEAEADSNLADRLIRALEAGRDAGGQATGDGQQLAERSAMVRTLGTAQDPGLVVTDLRVDLHSSAVHELRRLYEIHRVYAEYADMRDRDAPNSMSLIAYETAQFRAGGIFLERPSCFR